MRICSVIEVRGERVAHITQYFGAPFATADWRAEIVERIAAE